MKTPTLGKILGAVGLLLLLTSWYTYFITTGSAWLAGGKALLGLVLVGVFFATNSGQMTQFASRRSTLFFATSAATALLALVGLVALNYIAAKRNKSWDLTSKKIYTLAPQTRDTLHGLREKVTAIGFLPAKDPSQEPLENLFRRYQQEAPEKFEYTFKDPRKNPDLAAKYSLKAGQTTVVLTRGQGDKQTQTSLNIISEQELTNALLKLNAAQDQKVYFVAGHGEYTLEAQAEGAGGQPAPSVSELKQSLQQEGYVSASLNLTGIAEVPKDAALLVLAGTRAALADPEVKLLEKYLEEGGRLAYFADANQEPGSAMDALLSRYGVQVDRGIVADLRFANQSPYVLVSPFFSEHEIGRLLKGLQMNAQFPSARGLSVVTQGTAEGVKTTPVLTSSPFAWEETTPNDQPEPSDGEKTGQIPLVVASTRSTAQAVNKRFDEARVVVFGDSELLLNALWGYEPNRNLVMNAVAWTTNQVAKVTIRPPDRDISSVDIDEQMLSRIRFYATDLAPLTLLAAGLAIWIVRRNQ